MRFHNTLVKRFSLIAVREMGLFIRGHNEIGKPQVKRVLINK